MTFLKTAALAVTLGLTATTSIAQEVTLRFQHFVSPNSANPKYFLDPWVQKVEAESNGRIKIEIYPFMQLGGKAPAQYDLIKDGVIMGAVLFTASFLGAIYVLFTYLAPLMAETMGFGRDGITLVLLAFGAGAVVGNLIGGWLTDRLGSVKSLVILCLAQIVLMPMFSGLPVAPWFVFLLVFVWSIMGWSFVAPQQVRLLGLAPQLASVVLALNAAAIYVGTALGSGIGGLVQNLGDITWLGVAAGIVAFGALVHLLASHRAANIRAMS
jgi:predicted MFS family arabinose efflux permease